MRILYFDVDTLRADHLGCYGYPRPTTPVIDHLASRGTRFDQVHASDLPCLPSRTALFSGMLGVRTGAVNHGGTRADPYHEGSGRPQQTSLARHAWTSVMRRAGLTTATVSSFAERHSAYHWYAGFSEIRNVGLRGAERADEVTPMAVEWLDRHGRDDNWFLHVHFWDPHTPYRTPASFGDPFAAAGAPDWIDDEVLRRHWSLPGPHSAQEVGGFDGGNRAWGYPRQPQQIRSVADAQRLVAGYDAGVAYADHHIGIVLDHLARLGVAEDTAVIVSSDHGENLGELGIYADHQTADVVTARVPLIVAWPGGSGPAVDDRLRYQLDLAATVVDLLGQEVPAAWDGASFADLFRGGGDAGRDHLVISQAAWTVQRSVRFDRWQVIWTYDDGLHGFDDVMAFDVASDPHEQANLAADRPDVVGRAAARLAAWERAAMRRVAPGGDPFWTVLREGGGWYVRSQRAAYLERLRQTGRSDWAKRLEARGR